MVSNNEDQVRLREMISEFLVENPMSWYGFAKGCGISHTTLRKFAGGIDLKRVEPLFKMMKFMREYEK